MQQEKLIAKLIDLEERANAHTAEYVRLLHVPKGRTEASRHYRKAAQLRSKIQDLIRQIALCDDAAPSGPAILSSKVPSGHKAPTGTTHLS